MRWVSTTSAFSAYSVSIDHQTSSIWVGGRTDILITVAILLEVDGLVRMTRRFWSFAGQVAELDILSDLLF